MRTIEISAKTRELAIKEALAELGVERDEVHVEILDEGSKGLFGFGARNVKLKVSTDVPGPAPERGRSHGHGHGRDREREREQHAPRPEQGQRPRPPQQQHSQPQRHSQQQPPQRHAQQHPPQRQPREPRPPQHQRPEPGPRPEAPPRKPAPEPRVFTGPPDAEAESLVREMVERMGIEAVISSATGEGGAVSIKIESPDSAILIGRKGRSLESLQYLVNRMSPKTEGEDGERITIDIEGYLDRRQEALEDLARRLADRARETGRRQRTKPMGPQERRAIHVALEGDETIKTFSVGDAGDRHVVIAPADEKPGGDRPSRDRDRGPRGDHGPRGGRGPRNDRGPRGGDRRDRGPRGLMAPPFPEDEHDDGPRGIMAPPFPEGERDGEPGGDQPRAEGSGPPRRRRRSRRGGRGRGPRPDAPPAQNDAVESGPQDS